MRIKKTYRSAVQAGKVLNERSTSTDNTYSCDFMNKSTGYSTNEVKTGKTWLDGKTIYRKTVNLGALPNTSTLAVNHDIQNVERFISITGMALRASNNTNMPLPYVHATTPITIYANATQVVVETTNDRTAFTAFAILEYTKN